MAWIGSGSLAAGLGLRNGCKDYNSIIIKRKQKRGIFLTFHITTSMTVPSSMNMTQCSGCCAVLTLDVVSPQRECSDEAAKPGLLMKPIRSSENDYHIYEL